MSTAFNDTFSPKNTAILGGLLLLAIFVGEVLIGPNPGDKTMAVEVDTVEAIAMRIKPVVSLDDMRENMTVAAAGDAAADQPPDQLYQAACLACHTSGAAGAPKIGDAAAWKERLSKGLDSLVSSAINGIGAMPPRGGSQFSDDQMRAVVEYILAESK